MKAIYTAVKYLLLNYSSKPVLHLMKRVHYARKLRTFALENEPDMEVVTHLAGPGGYALDIGANFGLYTKVLSGLVGEHGRVYSIEPVPETFDILCSNIKKLRLGNVLPINKAISDTCGVVAMSIPRNLNMAQNFYRAHIVMDTKGSDPEVEVQAQTLDSLFSSDLGRFSFVKCDVEGHEMQCIRGARGFLEGSDASWLIEVSDDPDDIHSNAHALFHEFSRLGYGAWWFDRRLLHERKEGDASMNYFFLKPWHVDALRRNAPHLLSKGS